MQNAIIGSDNSVWGGFIGAFTLLSFNYFVVRALFKNRRLDQLITEKSVDLIKDGKPNHEAMRKELITETELLAVVRRQGFRHIKDVQRCVLDENGTFYIEGKTPPDKEVSNNDILKKIEELNYKIELLNSKFS